MANALGCGGNSMVVGQPTAARRLDAGATVGEIQSASTDPLASEATSSVGPLALDLIRSLPVPIWRTTTTAESIGQSTSPKCATRSPSAQRGARRKHRARGQSRAGHLTHKAVHSSVVNAGYGMRAYGASTKASQWRGRTTRKSRSFKVAIVVTLSRSATATTLASTTPRSRS